MFCSKYRGYKDFPVSLDVFSDRSFWRKLEEAEQVIAPLSEASYRLQRDENTLADVVVSFRDIFRGFAVVLSGYRSSLVDCVESRWQQCEQPLFMLTFLLNPATADDCRKLIQQTDHNKRVVEVEERLVQGGSTQTDTTEKQRIIDIKEAVKVVSSAQLAKFAVYYFRRLIGDDFGFIRSDLIEWIENTLTSAHPKEFRFNKVKFWQHVKKENPASVLPDLAIRLLSITVNTATTERLFSELGMIHTARRNRMTTRKTQDIQCIRQHLRERDHMSSQHEPTTKILDPTERPLVDRVACDEVELAMYASPASQHQATTQTGQFSANGLPPSTPQGPSWTPMAPASNNPPSQRKSPVATRRSTPTSQTPLRRSARQRTPTPQAAQERQGSHPASGNDDLDDIGDGVDGEDVFPRWKEYLDEVLEDDELGSEFAISHLNDSYHNWEFERIPSPDTTPFPVVDDTNFPQEKRIGGIRALKASLSALFSTTTPNSPRTCQNV
ncbi:hypothetical protein DVH05_001518 [Phytophthora capsici]|nr:hypothetical protein DVH05_016528 [Phytophthora capsici]KAG1706371.1 hypothetical protein DVH05_001518 [Phytophthora capsici]